MRRAALFLIIAVFLLFMSGCGSQSSSPRPGRRFEPSRGTRQPDGYRHAACWCDGSVLPTEHHGSLSSVIVRGERFAFAQHQSDPRKCHPTPDGLGFSR